MFKLAHTNFNVMDLQRSLTFYKEALGLTEASRKEADDGSFRLVFLTDSQTYHQVELTWLRDRTEPYDLSDNEIHLALHTDRFEEAYALHKKMGCVCQEIVDNRYYFIEDPDGYWIEIIRRP